MLYVIVIMAIVYFYLATLSRLEKKGEETKAKEEGYEVFFSNR